MRIGVTELENIIKMSQSVTHSSLKSKNEVLNKLTLIIREGKLYMLSQGEGSGLTIRLMVYVRDVEEQDADYIVDGVKISKVLKEVEDDEVEIYLESENGVGKSLTLKSSLGTTKYLSLAGQLNKGFDNEENFNYVYGDIEGTKGLVEEKGMEVRNEKWLNALGVLRATSSEMLGNTMVAFTDEFTWLNVPYLNIRYHESFPFERPLTMGLNVAGVFKDAVGYGGEMSKVLIQNMGRSFTYVSDKVYFSVYGLMLGAINVRKMDWDMDESKKGEVATDSLRRVIRVSDIFLDSNNEDIKIKWDYRGNKVKVSNDSVQQFGANLEIPLVTSSDQESVNTIVYGNALQRLLSLTEDDTVYVEVEEDDVEAIHVKFSEGDARIVYVK